MIIEGNPDALCAIDYLDEDDYLYIKQWLKERGVDCEGLHYNE